MNKSYRILEVRLEEEKLSFYDGTTKGGAANKKHISATDPDASVVRRGHGRSKLQCQVHRGVDEKHEIITATEVTPGIEHNPVRAKLVKSAEKWPWSSAGPHIKRKDDILRVYSYAPIDGFDRFLVFQLISYLIFEKYFPLFFAGDDP